MKAQLEYDIIKTTKFLLFLAGIIFLMIYLPNINWLLIPVLVLHTSIFLIDLMQRIKKGKWKYKPY